MNRRWLKRTLFALVSGVSGAALAGSERVTFADTVYHVYRVDKAGQGKLQLMWQGDEGKPLNNFTGVIKLLEKRHQRVAFAMNAGIFEAGPKPLGLTIIDGKELVPLNLQKPPAGEVPGNFFRLPNGVFYLDDQKGAGIMESREFVASGLKPRLAVQSGPMLLWQGNMHPDFRENSPNKRLRNGVGIRAKDGQILFAMSDRLDHEKGRVTFHQFAQFFRQNGCDNALFLDGDISDMLIDPESDTKIAPNTFAAMFVIAKDL